ncbi:MAG: 23S rRNA (adenine(2030)-N(6))-methyltransferase RlmJ [Arenimonas sp.]|nr:23S rRNA (adenine(2030)-N(6))-methyltransferase RlmJ [Arenimonas sp.]
MNYLHGFHAGNHADVLKHCVLLYLMNRLKSKDKAFFVLDTHAGRGQYLLQGEQAKKTGEAQEGIFKLITLKKLPDPVHFYLKQVERVNPVGSLLNYPGSPVLIAQQLREQDRLVCYESQKPEFDLLRQIFKNDQNVKTELGDGYQALKALLPPSERRGLVLIDPPYEAQEQEFQQILNSLQEALLRWPTGQFAIWYPIKQRRSLIGFFRNVAQLSMKSALVLELLVRKDNSPLRMNGSGMLIINPPYQMDTDLNSSMSKLVELLNDGDGSHRITWIKTES